jgi:hypothetical protein
MAATPSGFNDGHAIGAMAAPPSDFNGDHATGFQ